MAEDPMPTGGEECAATATAHHDGADSAAAAAAAAQPRTLFSAAIAGAPAARGPGGELLTDGFLDLCELIIPLIESFGSAFAIVRNDIGGNIARLRDRKALAPAQFERLFAIVEDEIARNDTAGGGSCAKGLLWLKRAMEFMVAIVKGLLDRPDATLSAVVHDCYHATLHRWHGWLASSAFAVAFAFVPHREPFMDRIAGGKYTDATAAEMRQFVDVFGGMLAEVHAFIDRNGLDDPCRA